MGADTDTTIWEWQACKQVQGARHALRRAGGARVATAVSSPAALHTVGQSVRAQGNRDEFTGVNRRGLMS